MSEKRKKVIKKTRLAGITFSAIAVVAFILTFIVEPKLSGEIGNITFASPEFVASNHNGIYAVNDSGFFVYIMDENNNYLAAIEAEDGHDISEMAFDDNGNIYLLVYGYNEDGTDQTIKVYDKNANFLRDIYYSDDVEEEYIMGMQIVGDELIYIESAPEYDAYIIADLDGKERDFFDIESLDGWTYITDAIPDGYGNYALNFNMYSAGMLYYDGEYEEYGYSDFDLYDNPEGYIFYNVVPYDDGLAVVANAYEDTIVSYIDAPYEESEELVDINDICNADILEEYKNDLYISTIGVVDDKLAISVFEQVYIYDDGNVREIDGCHKIPAGISILNFVDAYGNYIGCVCLAIGLILLIGSIAKWRLSLLGKQLIVTIPVIVIMFVILTISFINAYDDMYYDNAADRLLQLNESTIEYLDGDAIEEMSNFEALADGRMYDADVLLYNSLVAGQNDWSNAITCHIYLLDDELSGFSVLDSEFTLNPFYSRFDWGNSLDELIENSAEDELVKGRGDSAVIYSGSYYADNISAGTYIYNSYDEPVAFMITNLDFYYFNQERDALIRNIIIKVAAFLLILIALIVLLTYLNTRRLKLAGNAITEIAAGNFSARVNNVGRDEVGAICGGVNEMAQKLELHFEELDRNEKFYYKFVPEKFKELLHKDTFTDLQLGDAESVDLTVLFCDIRSFSLNSEMMTAKENFEFVNVIYGKAGPIIRKHNGFVDKYIGDAVMALFENADDALAAGKELYYEIVLNKATAEELGVQSINIGIGIHSGMARIGIVGEDERLSGTVISNTVNISSRLESLTKQYNTAMIITKETLDRLSDPDSLSVRYLGMIQVAGVNEVKALYEVLECLDDERKNTREQTAFDFREAIKAYHLGKAEASAKMLEPIVLKAKNDPVPKMYLDYVNEKIAHNDSEHNVFKFEKK